jgi:Fe-S-cluster containining protein
MHQGMQLLLPPARARPARRGVRDRRLAAAPLQRGAAGSAHRTAARERREDPRARRGGRKRTNLACALLADDGTCSAYEARPAQCRRYHSLRLASCEAFHANPSNDALESPLHPALAHNAAVIITQAQQAARAAGLDADNVDLNIALHAALTNPKAWRRWKDAKKPFLE